MSGPLLSLTLNMTSAPHLPPPQAYMVADKDVFKAIIMQRREAEFQVSYR